MDLHTHVLPGMDDGSPDTDTTRKLLERLVSQGCSVVCATSHYYANQEPIPEFLSRRQASIRRMTGMRVAGLQRIIPGAETAFFPRISECRELEYLCLYGTRTLMLEMPFSDWAGSQVEEVVSLSLDRDFQVVLVHPERFTFSKRNRDALEKLAELPVGFQVNANTLLRWSTRRTGLDLLEMSSIPLLGSDCHNLTSRAPHLDKARTVISHKLGNRFLRKMDENAAQVTARISSREVAVL